MDEIFRREAAFLFCRAANGLQQCSCRDGRADKPCISWERYVWEMETLAAEAADRTSRQKLRQSRWRLK